MTARLWDRPWEHGSGFHWIPPSEHHQPGGVWGEHVLYGTGRQALAAVLKHGVAERGWHRLWVPAYYCPETLGSIGSLGEPDLEIRVFDDGPSQSQCVPPSSDLAPGDVILVVNYFGLFSSKRTPENLPSGVDTVEDHTHDPWSKWARHSSAQYGFASLRKTLPVPDGGVVWSPRDESLPDPAGRSEGHENGAALRLESMLLKGLYLSRRPIHKGAYLDLERRSERRMGNGPIAAPSAITEELMPLMPSLEWRETRVRNFHRAVDHLEKASGITVLKPEMASEVPFSIVLQCRSRSERDRLKLFLIKERIYPAVLWELEPSIVAAFPEQGELAGCLLSVHCDFRYTEDDMDRVADVVIRGLDS